MSLSLFNIPKDVSALCIGIGVCFLKLCLERLYFLSLTFQLFKVEPVFLLCLQAQTHIRVIIPA